MKNLFYLPMWYFKNVMLKKEKPLQTVLFITDYCNLRCKHCNESGHAGTTMKPYNKIKEELKYAYNEGSRFVDFEGGEPTLWQDGDYRINDLIDLAKKIGFFSTTVTTNGQNPFDNLKADSIWVSVDGFKEYHDMVRGEGTFAKLNKNIAGSNHPAVSINMAINKLNYKSVVDVIKYAQASPHIKSVSLNFHTPYPGTEHMMLDWDKRCRIIDKIIAMKKEGYAIMNSVSGLCAMKKTPSSKYCWVSNFILTDGTRLRTCAGKEAGICDQCGFCMSGEMASVMKLKPDTILAGMKLRM